MQLRKCCNHPYLLPNAESEPFEVAEHLVAASSKLVLLDKLLAEILPKGEKVLIFSGFTRMLDILEDFMQLRGFKCTSFTCAKASSITNALAPQTLASMEALPAPVARSISSSSSRRTARTRSSSSRLAPEDSELT